MSEISPFMSSSVPAPATPAEGETLPRAFGRYLLFDHIGRGGMANIYLASQRTDLGAERLIVVKEMLPHLTHDDGFAKMLIAEAKLAAQLNHANVVQVTDLGRSGDRDDERLYIAMEYVEGFDLNQLLRRLSKARIPLPAEFAIFIVRETLRALDYAHRARNVDEKHMEIVHRDVSPSNVLISFEGEVKLCDFGIARAYGLAESESASDENRVARARVAGKSAYMSPEQARGEEIDARADVFAAGILLWELCAGRRLYKGTEEEMLAKAREGEVPPLPDRGLPKQEQLQQVLDRAFRTDRLERFQTAAEFLDALEDYAIGARLMASPLKFGDFLTEHFAEAIVQVRREREHSAKMLYADEPPEAENGSRVRAKPDRSPSSSPPPGEGSDGKVDPEQLELARADTKRIRTEKAEPRAEGGPSRTWIWIGIVAATATAVGFAVGALLAG